MHPLAISEVDEVIYTVRRESKTYDKNNSDHLARAIHLKPQRLSYPNSWLVVMEVLCVFISLSGSGRFLVLLDGFLWVLIVWVVFISSLWFLVVLGGCWGFLVVVGGCPFFFQDTKKLTCDI